MSLITIFLIAFALGIDAFSVCIGIGLCGVRKRQIYILSIVVALFHVFMPLVGMFIGHIVGEYIGAMANVFGAMVLLIIGGYYVITFARDRVRGGTGECAVDVSILSKPLGIIILASSVSIDALAVGFGLGALGMNVVASVLIIGIVAGIMTYAGLMLGKRLENIIGNKAELFGGILLISIAVYILTTAV